MNQDFVETALAQARELQAKLTEAMSKSGEGVKPHVDELLRQADVLRDTLIEHGRRSAEMTHEQTTQALDLLDHALQAGTHAMRAQTDSAHSLLDSFFEQAREAADRITKTFTPKP